MIANFYNLLLKYDVLPSQISEIIRTNKYICYIEIKNKFVLYILSYNPF